MKSFLYKVVDTTDIAELDLQVGDLELYVKRKVDTVAAAPPPAPAAPAPAAAPVAAAPSVEIELEEAEDSVDESAVYMTSEVVGIFRRGRYLKTGGRRTSRQSSRRDRKGTRATTVLCP